MSQRLETTVNVVTLIAAVAILGTVAARFRGPTESPTNTQPFRVGEHVPVFQGLDFTRAKHTLLMVVRQDCRFCAESMPFYRRLPRGKAVKLGATLENQIVALMLDDLPTATHYVQSNALSIDAVVAIPPSRKSDLRVKGTPTLLLVDGTGLIQRLWVGKLSPEREREVIDALAPGT